MLACVSMRNRAAEVRVHSRGRSAALPVLLNLGSGAVSAAPDGGRPAVGELTDACTAAGLRVAVTAAPGGGLAALARKTVAEGHDMVIAAGGDGTVRTVAAALVGTDAVLGVLPLGTLNHFAKDLGIPLEVPHAARAIADGRATRVDVGVLNGHVFVNNASLGLYPSLVYHREKRRGQGRRKWVATLLALARVWRSFRRVRVVVDDGDGARIVRTPFVFVGNNEYRLEGLRFGARGRLDRGVLHLAIAPGMTRAQMLLALARALAGRLPEVDHFDTLVTSEVQVHAWRRWLPVALDGEVTLLRTPLRYGIRRAALRVCIPRGGAQP